MRATAIAIPIHRKPQTMVGMPVISASMRASDWSSGRSMMSLLMSRMAYRQLVSPSAVSSTRLARAGSFAAVRAGDGDRHYERVVHEGGVLFAADRDLGHLRMLEALDEHDVDRFEV